MSKIYLITNDKGRSIAYQKAIEALKRCTHPIRTYEVQKNHRFDFVFISSSILSKEIKALPYVKQSLADKGRELIRTDDLVKLSAFQSRDDVSTCKKNILEYFVKL